MGCSASLAERGVSQLVSVNLEVAVKMREVVAHALPSCAAFSAPTVVIPGRA
jgi:hypothetical protein